MAEISEESLQGKYTALIHKRGELIEAINRIDGALEAVSSLYEELYGTDKEGSKSSCEVQGSDQEPDSKKKKN